MRRVEGKPSLRGLRWSLREPDDAALARLSEYPPVVARVLAIRGITPARAPTFLDPALSSLPEPDTVWADAWRKGPGLVALADWSAGGIVLARLVVEALRLGGRPEARLDPEGWPAPGLNDALALSRGLIAEHPSRASLLRSFLKLAAIAAIGEDLVDPVARTCVGLGLAELDRGRHGPGLASAMNASLAFPGGLGSADVRRVAERLALGGLLSVELLAETRPPEARELGARLLKMRDAGPPPWEALPEPVYELDVESRELTRGLESQLQQLEPTGPGFPEVVIRVRGGRIGDPRVIKKLHLKAKLDEGAVDLIWRGGASFLERFQRDELELYGHLGLSTWAGIQRLQLRVVDAI